MSKSAQQMHQIAAYRGVYGSERPEELRNVRLPPQPMPPRQGFRPLKQWRYVGVFGDELMLCAAIVRLGPARQTFWAVWDRERRELRERTLLRPTAVVRLEYGRIRVEDTTVQFDITIEETDGIETVHPCGDSYAWTRKQGGIEAVGTVTVAGRTKQISAAAVVDDTAGYYERHTSWRWSAGVGESDAGQRLAWNLVDGVNDSSADSERTIWIDGIPQELPPLAFSNDLTRVGGLSFTAEATRTRNENRLLVRSRYRQPFGTFAGRLPGGITLSHGYGVMEDHDVWW
jgi:Protein of unknown function (DUF2804)